MKKKTVQQLQPQMEETEQSVRGGRSRKVEARGGRRASVLRGRDLLPLTQCIQEFFMLIYDWLRHVK